MPVLTLTQAQDLVAAALARSRIGESNARSVARAPITAEADGLKGHGLSRVPMYMARTKYLSWPIEEPEKVLIRTEEVPKLLKESEKSTSRSV